MSSSDLTAAAEAGRVVRGPLGSAANHVEHPAVRLAAAIPVLGRSLVAERRVVASLEVAVDGVDVVLRAAPHLRNGSGVDLTQVSRLAADLGPLAARAREHLEDLRATPTDLAPSRVRRGVAEAVTALEPVVEAMDTGHRGAALTASLLGRAGPRELLVALGNNAELRGTGGYVSTFAAGRLDSGAIMLGPFRDVAGVGDTPARSRKVAAPPGFTRDYAPFLADTTLFREWTMSPHVPDAALVAANAAEVLLGTRPDIVLLLDVPALVRLVELSGQGVRLPGGTQVPTADLGRALLADSYAAAGQDTRQQDRRRAALRAAAGRAATALLSSDAPPLQIVRELGDLAAGRHLALWSDDSTEQTMLDGLGLSGSVAPGEDDLAMVSVNNLSANKLDLYVERRVSVDVRLTRDTARVTQRVLLRNRAPAGLVRYVAGFDRPGTIVERVELSLAKRAKFGTLRVDGRPARGGLEQGGQRTRVHTFVTLARGDQTEVVVTYSLPITEGTYRLRAVPQALANDADLSVVVRPGEGWRLKGLAGAEPHDGGSGERYGAWSRAETIAATVQGTN